MPNRDEIDAVRGEIARYILATADTSRRDRLWPAHFMIFGTNPLSVAYGASGIALYLHETVGALPPKVRDWMLDQPVSAADYPPGVFVGTAGIAHAFWQMGFHDRAEEVLAETYRSDLRFADPTLFLGAAGWGLVSLEFYRHTGRQSYLDRAAEAVEYLLCTARSESGLPYWHRADDELVNHGYGYGGSGIALFLLHAGLQLGREEAVAAARRALDFEIENRVEIVHGWTWPDRRGGSLALPYWGHGSSGVGTTAVRFYELLGEERYLQLAETIAEGAYCQWSVLPTLVEGLSGIADYFVDLFRATGRAEFMTRAETMADTVLWYALERAEGVTFPGRWLHKASNDYATGSAGVGMFLGRLLDPHHPRLLVDFLHTPPRRATPAVRAERSAERSPAPELVG